MYFSTMKQLLVLFIVIIRIAVSAQNDSIPSGIDASGNVDFSTASVNKGENINFEFLTCYNKQVSLKLYSIDGVLISTTQIEVFSDRGLALTTRSFEPGTYYMCLKLKTKTLIKKVVISP